MIGTIKRGFMVGLRVTWTFGKIIFPITLLISILQHTPVLPWVIDKIAPFMSLFGLSGDAAIPLVLGNALNIYAAIGAILSLDFTVKEVFIIAVMLSFSHSMILESGVAIKTGVKLWIVLLVRISLAIIAAIVINLLWQGGSEQAQYGFVSAAQSNEAVSGWLQIGLAGLKSAIMGVVQLAIIVIPLMIGIQILKDLKWVDVFSRWMAPVTRSLGMNPNTSTTLAAGLILGLAYGAGVMIQAVKEDGVSKKDLTIAFIFLSACHAVIEDTLIFAPLGIPVLPLLFIRLLVAIVLTATVALIWNKSITAKTRSKKITYEQ
ncbi:nucleoside recognition domain-containing protein [Niallia oryzisoli]|uniref:nucleoside recognition domain-containing protein n=1 Tax=Niallia oryzisoli TaxID=1737571 RepID=UPI003736A9D7